MITPKWEKFFKKVLNFSFRLQKYNIIFIYTRKFPFIHNLCWWKYTKPSPIQILCDFIVTPIYQGTKLDEGPF